MDPKTPLDGSGCSEYTDDPPPEGAAGTVPAEPRAPAAQLTTTTEEQVIRRQVNRRTAKLHLFHLPSCSPIHLFCSSRGNALADHSIEPDAAAPAANRVRLPLLLAWAAAGSRSALCGSMCGFASAISRWVAMKGNSPTPAVAAPRHPTLPAGLQHEAAGHLPGLRRDGWPCSARRLPGSTSPWPLVNLATIVLLFSFSSAACWIPFTWWPLPRLAYATCSPSLAVLGQGGPRHPFRGLLSGLGGGMGALDRTAVQARSGPSCLLAAGLLLGARVS